jgi:hypothetical protein
MLISCSSGKLFPLQTLRLPVARLAQRRPGDVIRLLCNQKATYLAKYVGMR